MAINFRFIHQNDQLRIILHSFTVEYILRCNIPYFSRIQRPYYKSLTKNLLLRAHQNERHYSCIAACLAIFFIAYIFFGIYNSAGNKQ